MCCPFRTNYKSSSHQRCSMFIFLNKVAGLQSCNFTKKGALAQVLSCEFCETFKNTFFYRTPLDDCFYNHLDLYRHLHCNSKDYVCGSEAYLEPYLKPLTVSAKKLQTFSYATLLKKKLQHSWFQVNLISKSNNLFQLCLLRTTNL